MTPKTIDRFDPAGPLPSGTTVLEASAGTGKTHAIAGLAVRYLAEGIADAAHLAVITFSRSAAGELGDRVRARLRRTLAVLERVQRDDGPSGQPLRETVRAEAATSVPPKLDPVDACLASCDADELARRVANLRRAMAEADQLIAMTIHEFCGAMVDELGVLATHDPQAVLTDDLGMLAEDLIRDLYLRWFANSPTPPPFTLAQAQRFATEAIHTPDAALEPHNTADPATQARVDFATEVRELLEERKRRAQVYSFDDQLSRLRDCVVGPDAQAACGRVRDRCRVVLVDEFQDTDPVQWEILRACFHGHSRLVLIGDPKQAIYGFRGADVMSYRAAVEQADAHAGLAINYRSDAGVVAALNQLFDGVSFGPGISFPPVEADHVESRLIAPDGSPWRAPVRLRCVAQAEPLPVGVARRRIEADLVAQVGQLLDGQLRLVDDPDDRPLRGDDIAVLVRTNERGRELAHALTSAGVAAAFSGSDSVFASTAAKSWLALLTALEEPRRANLRAAIITDFVGGTLAGLATASDEQFADWSALFARWAATLAAQGVAALFATIQAESRFGEPGFGERLMARRLGERDLTDYRHVAQLLHERQAAKVTGAALVEWLAAQLADARTASAWTRKLETDEHAVQVMTIHRAKGLQFPVVLLPQAGDLWVNDRDDGAPLRLHLGGRRVLDVGGAFAPGRAERLGQYRAEDADDELRVFYVAATRAQSALMLWWPRTKANTAASALQRLLFRPRDAAGAGLEETARLKLAYPVDVPPGDGRPADLSWIAGSGIAVTDVTDAPPTLTTAPRPPAADLGYARWTRKIDTAWRRTSYSGLTAGVHEAPVALGSGAADESEPDEAADAAAAGQPSPMADLPSGTSFGTVVHAVFETLDWHAPTPGDESALTARLTQACAEALRRAPLTGVTPTALAQGLLPALLTGLGPLADGLRMADLRSSDRLTEVDFEYPFGGGAARTTLADVADLLAAHLPADDPLAAYPATLRDPALRDQPLRGFITGSIDAIVRVGTPPRHLVIDYKTNRIAVTPELTIGHFSQAAMAAEMIRAHYPLQALVYSVALHRFLTVRLPGYRPETHLGGAGYLFVRGMAPSADPAPVDLTPNGVFAWRIPPALVVALSELLGGRDA